MSKKFKADQIECVCEKLPNGGIDHHGCQIHTVELVQYPQPPDSLFISHGRISHPASRQEDCLECIDVQIFWYKELKKAGGISKFKKKLENDILKNS